jgi:hypothetical protein
MSIGDAPLAVTLTYWSPSAGNFLSALVIALGADLRNRDDAMELLQTISDKSREELLHLIGEPHKSLYLNLCSVTFTDIRARAIAIVKASLDAA